MTPHEARNLSRTMTVETSGHPGIVVGIGDHGFLVIWEGEKRAAYIKFEDAENILIK
jgi:hypothetical protein